MISDQLLNIVEIIAVVSTLLFALKVILSLAGIGDFDFEIDTDDDSGGFLNAILAFFSISSMTFLYCCSIIMSPILSIGVSIFAGLIAAIIITRVLKILLGFQEEKPNWTTPENMLSLVGDEGSLFLKTGPETEGLVKLKIDGVYRYLKCLADEDLPTGEQVEVIDYKESFVIVSKIK